MNPALLLAQFERLADAPDAIPRLRRFILDLAVRGKLVAQVPTDEPARLTASAAGLEKERPRPRGKTEPPTGQPYQLPGTWRWVRIGDQIELLNGMAFKPSDWVSTGIRIVRIQNLNRPDAPFNFCEPKFARERSLIDDGAFLISWSGTPGTSFGAFIWDRGPAVLNQHIFRCDFKTSAFSPEYLRLAINGRLDEMIENAHGGVGLQHITKGKLEAMLIALPPLAEQHRIVAKVDELMALCDRLEAARNEREGRRDRLVAASLHRLSQPAEADDADAFRANARFYFNHLPRLTTRPDHIKQLRQTILNLAVRSRLVPQDPNDEPASKLLSRLMAERKFYASENNLSLAIPDPIEQENVPFSVAPGWTWTRLCTLFNVVTDGDHQPPPKSESGVAFLTIGNVTTGQLEFSGCRFVSRSYVGSLPRYRRPELGDLLYTVVGATYGRPALVDTDREFCVQRHIAILKPARGLKVGFLVRLLASPLVYEQASQSR